MSFREIMEEQRKDKELVDSLQIHYLDNQDVEVCNYVSDQLSKVRCLNTSIEVGNSISYDELIDTSLEELSRIDNNLAFEVMDILKKAFIRTTDDTFGFGTYINYRCDDYNNIPVFGRISGYLIPKELYQISSVFFSHEHIHALKDTVYYEYVFNNTLGETIPMFYELISCRDDAKLRVQVLKVRLKFLLDNDFEYRAFSNFIRDKKHEYSVFGIRNALEEVKLYEFLRSKVGCYLNSYYYAIMLYHLYREDPSKILSLVSMVLRQEMTTLDLLDSLGIYGDVRGETFEKEFNNVKKLVR